MDDRWWLKKGVPPFPGPVDDWPAERAHWLQVVMTLEDKVVAEKEAETRAQSDAQRIQAEAKANQQAKRRR